MTVIRVTKKSICIILFLNELAIFYLLGMFIEQLNYNIGLNCIVLDNHE